MTRESADEVAEKEQALRERMRLFREAGIAHTHPHWREYGDMMDELKACEASLAAYNKANEPAAAWVAIRWTWRIGLAVATTVGFFSIHPLLGVLWVAFGVPYYFAYSRNEDAYSRWLSQRGGGDWTGWPR